MIQINLLPDVKQEYLRAKRTRNTVITGSIIAGLASAGVVVLLLVARGVQFGLEFNADRNIAAEYARLSEVDDLTKLVTLQSQIATISTQHQAKSMDSRLFKVLQAVNPGSPNNVQFTAVVLQPEENNLNIEGVASGGYRAVETLKKTIDNTTIEYSLNGELVEEPIAESVLVGETAFGEGSDGRRVLSFAISVTFNKILFTNEAQKLKIKSPERSINVTDSKVGVPDSLFTRPAKGGDDA